MQAEGIERNLVNLDLYVNGLFEFVISHSEDYEAHEMEEAIKEKVLEFGRHLMGLYFTEKGTGDKGLELEVENTLYKRDRRLYKRNYHSIFGKIEVYRTCYRYGDSTVFPLDKEANLPERSYSYVLQDLMNYESMKNAYKESSETIEKFLGIDLSVKALEDVSCDSSNDYDSYYEDKEVEACSCPIIVINYDGKGIPMDKKESAKIKGREEDKGHQKVRLGKGEKKQKKKEALAGVCYETEEKIRKGEEIARNLVFGKEASGEEKEAIPKGQNIRRMASIEKSKKEVVEEMKKEAEKRDPDHQCKWAIVMDGAPYLWKLVLLVFKGIAFVPILDIIHVTEYIWDAGNALFNENFESLPLWVYEKLVDILNGKVEKVIKELKEKIEEENLKGNRKSQIERTIGYFENHKQWMKYDQYLNEGMPIASGIVESTCGHLIKDRMEKTGCRWTIQGAENILKLRSIKTSNDWDNYWGYHIANEQKRLYDYKLAA